MKNSILCSVIVLTYRQLEWLPRTLASIAKQDYSNIEVIIADDGTPNFDSSKVNELCRASFVDKNYKFYIVPSEKNEGTVKNFNKGIKSAHGEIIIPMAGDNLFFSEIVVSEIVKSFKEQGWLIATGFQTLCKEEKIKEIRPYINEINMIKKMNPKKLAIRLAAFPCFIGGAATIYTKTVFDRCGMFDEKYKLLEDAPYYVSILMKGEKIRFINKILVQHNIDGPKTKRNLKLVEDDIRVIDDLLNGAAKIPFFQKRMLKYRKLLLQEELGEKITLYKYPDCFIQWVWYRIGQKFFRQLQILIYKKKSLSNKH